MSESTASESTVRSGALAWRPVPTPGVSIKVLRRDAASGGSTALLRFEAGAHFPAHDHPGGEEVLVLEGDLHVGPAWLKAGDYLYTPPGGIHAAHSDAGCVFVVTLPRPIVILGA